MHGPRNRKRRHRTTILTAAALGLTVLSLTATGTGSASSTQAAKASGTPGFGDMSLKAMIAARKSIPVPKNLPNFNGETVTVMGDGGHNMNVFGFWMPEWRKAGIKLKAIEVPFADVYSKEKAEFIAGTNAVDLVVFYPAYIGDFASNGYLKPLDSYISKDNPHLNDVITAFRKLYLGWGGKTYALPEDGDVHLFIYRKDLLNNPLEQKAFQAKYHKKLTVPKTWADYLQVGQFFTRKAGQQLAGKTLKRPFYGCAEYGQRGFSFAWFVDRWASSGQVYFDKNMTPQIDSPQAIAALRNMVAAVKTCSPPDVLNFGYDQLRDSLLKNQTFMVVQWSDVPKKGADPAQSQVVGKLGYSLLPGTMVGGKLITRSMMPVGRVLAIPSKSKHADAAYFMARYISDTVSRFNVSTPLDGLDPYRYSQLKPQYYKEFTPTDAKAYLATVKAALEHGYPEIYIPGAAQYEDALDLAVNKAISGQEDPAKALHDAAKAWNDITNKLDKKHQTELWNAALKQYKSIGLIK